jgi:hypothetical protein
VVKGALIYSNKRREFPSYFYIDCRTTTQKASVDHLIDHIEKELEKFIGSSVEFASEYSDTFVCNDVPCVVCFDNVDTSIMMSAQFGSLVSKLREQKVKVVITTTSSNSLPDVRPNNPLYPSFSSQFVSPISVHIFVF